MRIIDCTMFFNELDLLKIRLSELDPYVDHFIIVESEMTFSGKERRRVLLSALLYDPFFKPYLEDVRLLYRFLNAEDFKGCSTPWQREYLTRNFLGECVQGFIDAGVYNDNDCIILSDMDEIPRGDRLHEAAAVVQQGHLAMLTQRLSYYYVNCVAPGFVSESRMFPVSFLKDKTMQELRQTTGVLVDNGGWHFSYMGGVERIREKLDAYAHTELNTAAIRSDENLWSSLRTGRDLFGRTGEIYYFEPVDTRYPQIIQDNPDGMFDHLIWRE